MISTKTESTLNDDNYEELLKTICVQSTVPRAVNVKQSFFEEELTKNTLIDKSKVTFKLDCLKAEECNTDDIFSLQKKYEEAVNKRTTPTNLNRIATQLQNFNPYACCQNEINPNVSPMSSIENMVESTYCFDSNKKFQMAEEICYLRMLAVKWRPIGGDGNCFYRSAMFSYLENIIFERDITMIQRIAVEIEEKFDVSYINTKNLPATVRDPITKLDRRIIITILKLIIDVLDSSTVKCEEATKAALNLLTNAFNCSFSFDTAMIIYLRYKLYEFILENKNKFFSEDFPVKVGNLLPFQYETEEGEFLFDKFFSEELLKLYTYAEKLAIYLTPFVLKVNLRVIFYDFGKDCNIQTKDFLSYLQDKETLTVLYRKAHYDIAYNKEYIKKYDKSINHFNAKQEELLIVKESLIEYYNKNEVCEVDLQQSKIYSKKDKMKKKVNQSDNNCDNSKNSAIVTTTTSTSTTSENTVATEYTKINDTSELQDLELKIKTLEQELNVLRAKNENSTNKCIQCKEIVDEADKDKDVSFTLPCGCFLDNPKCIEEYLKLLFKDYSLNLENNPKACPCSKAFSMKDLMLMATAAEEKLNISSHKNALIENYKNYCMHCKRLSQGSQGDKKIKVYKDHELFNKVFYIKRLEHYVCAQCEMKKTNECKICESHHLLIIK